MCRFDVFGAEALTNSKNTVLNSCLFVWLVKCFVIGNCTMIILECRKSNKSGMLNYVQTLVEMIFFIIFAHVFLENPL